MPVTWLEEREGKKARERRRRIRQTEFLRERELFFRLRSFSPSQFSSSLFPPHDSCRRCYALLVFGCKEDESGHF